MDLVVVGVGAVRDKKNPHTWSPTGGNALYLYHLTPKGVLNELDGPVAAGTNPMSIASHEIGTKLILYSVEMGDESGIRSFEFDKANSKLKELNKSKTDGNDPCHIIIVTQENTTYCVAALYSAGTVNTFKVESDGKLSAIQGSFDLKQCYKKQEHPRQDAPHPHGLAFNGGLVYVADLGCNLVVSLKLDFGTGSLEKHAEYEIPNKGAGPRHLAFTNDGKQCYIINELDNTVTVAQVEKTGALLMKASYSTLPEGYNEPPPFDFYDAPSHAAEIVISQDQKYVYATNRGHDSVAVLKIEGDTLKTDKFVPTTARLPWTVAEVVDSPFVVVSNQFNKALKDPGNVTVFDSSASDWKVTDTITQTNIMAAVVTKATTADTNANALPLPTAFKSTTYEMAVQVGKELSLAAHFPVTSDGTIKGKIGADMTTEDASKAAGMAASSMLATIKSKAGSLDKVTSILEITACLNTTDTFTEHEIVMKGVTSVLEKVFGKDVGFGTRSVVGVTSLPDGAALQVAAKVQLLEDKD
eukprot:m.342936 g.342936  ORF g.342936 m.342936 type:complete len:527 (-) comp22059_c0_seq1:88-1668(-)